MTCGVLFFVHGRQIESFWEWKHNYTDGFPTKSRSTTGRFFAFINLSFDLTQLILPRNYPKTLIISPQVSLLNHKSYGQVLSVSL